MTRYDITNGERAKVISRDAAEAIANEEAKAQAISFQVISGGTTRLVSERGRSQAQDGETWEVGDQAYIDPNGLEWYAHADGQDVTVEASLVRYKPLQRNGN